MRVDSECTPWRPASVKTTIPMPKRANAYGKTNACPLKRKIKRPGNDSGDSRWMYTLLSVHAASAIERMICPARLRLEIVTVPPGDQSLLVSSRDAVLSNDSVESCSLGVYDSHARRCGLMFLSSTSRKLSEQLLLLSIKITLLLGHLRTNTRYQKQQITYQRICSLVTAVLLHPCCLTAQSPWTAGKVCATGQHKSSSTVTKTSA